MRILRGSSSNSERQTDLRLYRIPVHSMGKGADPLRCTGAEGGGGCRKTGVKKRRRLLHWSTALPCRGAVETNQQLRFKLLPS